MKKKMVSALLITTLVASLFGVAQKETVTVKGADLNDGLVAHWTFDGDLTESKNGMNAKNGAKAIAYVDGIYGKAASFNGKDNYLTVDANPILNLGNSRTENNDNFTISFWVNLGDCQDKAKVVLDKGVNAGWNFDDDCLWTNPYRITMNGALCKWELSNAFIDPTMETEGSATIENQSIDGNQWYLMTYTYDGKVMRIYRNNQLIDSNNYSDGMTFNDQALYIGVNGEYLQDFFKGSLDDLRMYNKTLSYGDVEALYQAGLESNKEFIEPSKQLVAYYAFDGDLKDGSRFENNAKKVAMGGSTTFVPGMNGKAVNLKKGNYIEIPFKDNLNLSYDFTVSFWVRSLSSKDQSAPLLYFLNPAYGSTDNENDFAYKVAISSWGEQECTTISMDTRGYDSNSWTYSDNQTLDLYYGYSENKIKTTKWTHVTYTYTYDEENDTGMFKAYLNGVLKNKTDELSNPDIVNAAGSLYIGYDNETFFTGAMDELKIYNRCLDQDEVKKEAKRVDFISCSTDVQKALKSLSIGKKYTISSVTLKDVDTKEASAIKSTDEFVNFTSSNKKIFTVTSKGVITPVKKGSAKITITYGGITKTYNVVIK